MTRTAPSTTVEASTSRPRPTTRRRIHWRDIGANWLAFTVIAILALPAVWIILTAFRPNLEVNASPPIWLPRAFTLDAFESLFGLNPETASGVPVMSYLTNSLSVALLATGLSVPIGTAAGYAFSRFDFIGSRALLLLLLLTRAVPGVALSLPLFLLMRNIGLIDTIHGLAFVYMALNIPFTAWLMDGFFRRIPRELDDAAYVDGASHWQTFWKIDLPLALPGLGAASVFAFLAAWNEYQIASIITKTPAAKTFPVGLSDFTTQFTVDWRGMAAMSVLMMIPAIIFVLAMQRSLTKGLTFGAVKG
jgi:multiple sugar transport system permease protein